MTLIGDETVSATEATFLLREYATTNHKQRHPRHDSLQCLECHSQDARIHPKCDITIEHIGEETLNVYYYGGQVNVQWGEGGGVGVVRALIGVTDNVHSNSVLPLAGPLKVDSTINLSPQNWEAHHL